MSALPTGDIRTVYLTVPAPDKAAWVGASRARGQRLGDYLLERIRCGELPLIEPSAAGIAAWRARIGACAGGGIDWRHTCSDRQAVGWRFLR